jgi:septum formation protein
MAKKDILLGSSSPQRKMMFDLVGLNYFIVPADIDEKVLYEADSFERTEKLSRLKCEALVQNYSDSVVVCGDSYGVCNERIFEKAQDKKSAAKMLNEIAGKKCEIVSGYAVWDPSEQVIHSGHDVALVHMDSFSTDDVLKYLEYDEWKGKAPPFSIFGRGMRLVRKLEGSFYTTMGLPLEDVLAVLKKIEVTLD